MRLLRAAGVFCLGLGLVLIAIIWEAYVVSLLWSWFIVPLGVAAIGKAHALGITVLLALMRNNNYLSRRKLKGWAVLMSLFLPALFTLVLGAIARFYM